MSIDNNIFVLELLNKYEGNPFAISIFDLGLSTRAHNVLIEKNILYIGNLCCTDPRELRNIRNFGRKSFDEIQEVLSWFGLRMGMKDLMNIREEELNKRNKETLKLIQ